MRKCNRSALAGSSGLLALLLAAALVVAGCRGGADQAANGNSEEPAAPEAVETDVEAPREAAAPVEVDDADMPSDPVEGAKWALRTMSGMNNPADSVQMLTNSSAAALGTVMVVPLGMMAAMTGDADLVKELEDVLSKYELPAENTLWADEPLAAIESRGRELFGDMIAILEKHRPEDAEGGSMVGNLDIEDEMERLVFEVVDEKTVQVTHSDQNESFEIRMDDGRWRMHLGDLADIREQMDLPAEPPTMGALPME